ncbi:MAG: hypothetical protein QW838_02835 [Candidatus Nitrosotenuis sp.]
MPAHAVYIDALLPLQKKKKKEEEEKKKKKKKQALDEEEEDKKGEVGAEGEKSTEEMPKKPDLEVSVHVGVKEPIDPKLSGCIRAMQRGGMPYEQAVDACRRIRENVKRLKERAGRKRSALSLDELLGFPLEGTPGVLRESHTGE